jgi:hypothetical protein
MDIRDRDSDRRIDRSFRGICISMKAANIVVAEGGDLGPPEYRHAHIRRGQRHAATTSGNARVSSRACGSDRPGDRELPCEFSLLLVERVAKKRSFQRDAESPSRTGVARVTRALPKKSHDQRKAS